VKAGSGTTVEVDGAVKNGDTQQHDIFVKATLFNASGADIGSATKNVENVNGTGGRLRVTCGRLHESSLLKHLSSWQSRSNQSSFSLKAQ
jgi:hypothetical protein